MSDHLIEILKEHSAELSPIPTETKPRLQTLEGIRGVMFDIYGTLVISGSGDVGTADEHQHDSAFQAALKASGWDVPDANGDVLQEAIRSAHQTARAAGTEYPEVEIREIWQTVLREMGLGDGVSPAQIEALAIQHEVRANPVWPMPNCKATLDTLRERGLVLGIISNAQFYTPLLFPALLGQDLDELGTTERLRIFSFEHRQAKPGLFLYQLAEERLREHGLSPENVLYVGNDMLKDIYPANQLGFRTALFAGDARSLRLRESDERVKGLVPDLIVTDLQQIPECLQSD